jgi:hypothetical protein
MLRRESNIRLARAKIFACWRNYYSSFYYVITLNLASVSKLSSWKTVPTNHGLLWFVRPHHWDTCAVAEVRVVNDCRCTTVASYLFRCNNLVERYYHDASLRTSLTCFYSLPSLNTCSELRWSCAFPMSLSRSRTTAFLSPNLRYGITVSSSYPTFDDDEKLSAEYWVYSFVPDFLFGRKPLQSPSLNCW